MWLLVKLIKVAIMCGGTPGQVIDKIVDFAKKKKKKKKKLHQENVYITPEISNLMK